MHFPQIFWKRKQNKIIFPGFTFYKCSKQSKPSEHSSPTITWMTKIKQNTRKGKKSRNQKNKRYKITLNCLVCIQDYVQVCLLLGILLSWKQKQNKKKRTEIKRQHNLKSLQTTNKHNKKMHHQHTTIIPLSHTRRTCCLLLAFRILHKRSRQTVWRPDGQTFETWWWVRWYFAVG